MQISSRSAQFLKRRTALFGLAFFKHSSTPSAANPKFALEHDPEKACPALDAGWVPVFGKRSCSKKRIERDDDSRKSHHALAVGPQREKESEESGSVGATSSARRTARI